MTWSILGIRFGTAHTFHTAAYYSFRKNQLLATARYSSAPTSLMDFAASCYSRM